MSGCLAVTSQPTITPTTDIPDPLEIGPYKNIVLHVGVNDIRTNYEGQTTIMKNIETLESKCKMLLTAYPKSKIFLCPILPTKDSGKNHRVNLMNGGITEIAHKYTNVVLMENYYSLFTCEDGTLNPRLGRFYQGVPNKRDEVHLGNAEIRLLARCINPYHPNRPKNVNNLIIFWFWAIYELT